MRSKIIVILILLLTAITAAPAATQKVLYTFTGGVDGSGPYVGLVFDKAGNLYGVTEMGGLYGQGTVFRLSPMLGAGWTETVIYNFTGGTDGGVPDGNLWFDGSGNLHGTAAIGGDPDVRCGTSFMLSPSEDGWTYTVTHTYLGAPKDGCGPASDGSTTVYGGKDDEGWASFRGFLYNLRHVRGSQPWGSLRGDGYGTAYGGGRYGFGSVYHLTVRYSGANAPQRIEPVEMTTHAFTGGKNGGNPMGDLLVTEVNGTPVMYGTTFSGGSPNHGVVYQLLQHSKGDYRFGWRFSVLHRFTGVDGNHPCAGLTADSAGNLYGTTTWGGANEGYAGSVFKMTPTLNRYNKIVWKFTTLYSFSGGADGGSIYSPVILDAAGNLYGTTYFGGAYGQGVVYQIIP